MIIPPKYELYIFIECSDGVDHDPCTMGDGIDVIKYLLKNDMDLKNYRLVKIKDRKGNIL